MIIISSVINWIKALFQSYYACSLLAWIKSVLALAVNNDFLAGFMSIITVLGITAAELTVTDETFGTTKIVIAMVIGTVLLNTFFGIRKSLIKEQVLFAKAQRYPFQSKEYNAFFHRSKRYAFSWKKLQFVVFKCFMLLGYLYFVKNLLESEGSDTFLDFSVEVLCKAPIAIFWFYEFKSIGENSTYIYGKKASIFKIVEAIFEPRIFKFFGKKTPADGVHDIEMDPADYNINEDSNNRDEL